MNDKKTAMIDVATLFTAMSKEEQCFLLGYMMATQVQATEGDKMSHV